MKKSFAMPRKSIENEYELEADLAHETPSEIFKDPSREFQADPLLKHLTTLRLLCFVTIFFFILCCLFLCGIYFSLHKSIEVNKRMDDLNNDIKSAQIDLSHKMDKIFEKLKRMDDLNKDTKSAQIDLSHKIDKIFANVKGWLGNLHPECIDDSKYANCKLIAKGNYCHNFYYRKICCRTCLEQEQSQ